MKYSSRKRPVCQQNNARLEIKDTREIGLGDLQLSDIAGLWHSWSRGRLKMPGRTPEELH
jgi:hypothetical protein